MSSRRPRWPAAGPDRPGRVGRPRVRAATARSAPRPRLVLHQLARAQVDHLLQAVERQPYSVVAWRRILALALFHQRRILRIGLIALDDQMTQYRIVEFECIQKLGQRRLAALDIHQHVMGLVKLLDGICELAAPPVLDAVDRSARGLYQALVAAHGARHLLALVRMDHEHDFIMTHGISLWVPRSRDGAVSQGG